MRTGQGGCSDKLTFKKCWGRTGTGPTRHLGGELSRKKNRTVQRPEAGVCAWLCPKNSRVARVQGARGPACGPMCGIEKRYMADWVGTELGQRLRPGNWEVIVTVQARDCWLGIIEPMYGAFRPMYFPSLHKVIGPVFH